MLAPLTYQPQFQMKVAPISASNGLSRVFAAAVVNHQFRQVLLDDPHTALQAGYLDETFKLSDEERDLIVSIRAASLSDLARQVNMALGGSH
jgi:hypothetical protein